MMTHDGPRGSKTTLDHIKENETIVFGSPSLKKFLSSNQSSILCNIHGHAHMGSVLDRVPTSESKLQVINPGSLVEGQFCELTLKRDTNQKWIIATLAKHFL